MKVTTVQAVRIGLNEAVGRPGMRFVDVKGSNTRICRRSIASAGG